MIQQKQFTFENRREAGELLSEKLKMLVGDEEEVLVLGLPRGGVPVAYEVARALKAPLDILVVRKLGVPGHEESAMGAIASGGFQTLDEKLIAWVGIPWEAVRSTILREQDELERRESVYRGGCDPLSVSGRTVILVDDGIATGSSVLVALDCLRSQGARKIIVAAPVCSMEAFERICQEADEIVCVMVPERFGSVGAWYDDFSETSDKEVCGLLDVEHRCSGPPATSSHRSRGDIEVLRHHVQPLLGASTDYDALLERIGDSLVVLIGEASHGTHEFYRERAEITKRLIEEKDFDAVLIEADCPDTYRIDQYVCGRSEAQDSVEALAGFKHFPAWMWRNADVLDFVGWLRDHNEQRLSEDGLVRMYGLDLYSMHRSMNEVVRYLAEVDPPAAARARHRYSCLERFGENPQNYGLIVGRGMSHGCEKEVVGQLMALRAKEARYLMDDGVFAEDHHFIAEQNARSVRTAERYYRAMFHSGPESWNLRDDHMMECLEEVREHLIGQRGRAKVVVWAHNSHLGDASKTAMGDRGERNLGELVRRKYGHMASLIGMTTNSGTVTAAAGWHLPPRRMEVTAALEGSYEALFHRVGVPRFYLDLAGGSPATQALVEPMLERAIGVVYRPETERESHYFAAKLSKQFDAILHFDETRAVEPLEKTGQWLEGELPESYPSGI